jgi:phage shock protein PspC (stress-responsive transcriptional regulator)
MRDGRGAMLGGVAAGFAEYLDVDPVLVRLGFVLLAFVNGLGVLFYLVCWLVMPRREAVAPSLPSTAGTAASSVFDEARAAGERLAAEVRAASPDAASAQLGVGSLLVIVGALLLGHNLDWFHWPHWLRFDTLWPLLLVALGVGLIAKSRRSASA